MTGGLLLEKWTEREETETRKGKQRSQLNWGILMKGKGDRRRAAQRIDYLSSIGWPLMDLGLKQREIQA